MQSLYSNWQLVHLCRILQEMTPNCGAKSDFSRIHIIQSFLVFFRDFQMHVTLRRIDRF